MSLINSLTSAFKGGSQSRVPITGGFVSPWAVAFDTRQGRSPFQYEKSVREGFLSNPVAQRAVRIVAEGIGSAQLDCGDQSLGKLLSATSAGQSLIETLASHLLLHGNGFIQIMKDGSGKPVELFALRPERIRIISSDDGWPCEYAYKLADRTVSIPIDDENGWPNIIQLKAFNPVDDHYGASSLQAAEQAVAIHNAASEWNRALLENAARPSGALVHETDENGGLTPEQFSRLREELTQAFSGHGNAGRPMLLEGGLKWQSLSMSPADMDFATLKSAAARDIALAFGVPPMLLGLPGDNTYANYREANRALWRQSLLPLAGKILSGIQEGLAPWFPGASVAIDLNSITALSEDRERLWKQVASAEFLSNAEKRKMLGIDQTAEAV